jgi:replication factor C subunit 3/5
MRRALNILQASNAAFRCIDETAVYTTTGSPLPIDIQRVSSWVLNEDFASAVQRMFNRLTFDTCLFVLVC